MKKSSHFKTSNKPLPPLLFVTSKDKMLRRNTVKQLVMNTAA